MTSRALHLENRAVIRLSGADVRKFLQGLVTNDVMKAVPGVGVYAALLTPQGKFMYDMIIMADGDDLLLDVAADRKDELIRRLTMYKLRADVTITDEGDLKVWAVFAGDRAEGIAAPDPRDAALGYRVISAVMPGAAPLPQTEYESKRLTLGVPDSSRDMEVEKYFWLETDAERLNGVSFSKGCYVGQELTARMKHRTTLKKRLVAVKAASGGLEAGQEITTAEGKSAGEIRTTDGTNAIAYFRLEFTDATLNAGATSITLA
jgi:folate-binding protein YgfZ